MNIFQNYNLLRRGFPKSTSHVGCPLSCKKYSGEITYWRNFYLPEFRQKTPRDYTELNSVEFFWRTTIPCYSAEKCHKKFREKNSERIPLKFLRIPGEILTEFRKKCGGIKWKFRRDFVNITLIFINPYGITIKTFFPMNCYI